MNLILESLWYLKPVVSNTVVCPLNLTRRHFSSVLGDMGVLNWDQLLESLHTHLSFLCFCLSCSSSLLIIIIKTLWISALIQDYLTLFLFGGWNTNEEKAGSVRKERQRGNKGWNWLLKPAEGKQCGRQNLQEWEKEDEERPASSLFINTWRVFTESSLLHCVSHKSPVHKTLSTDYILQGLTTLKNSVTPKNAKQISPHN